MMKIMKLGAVSREEIFARPVPEIDVSAVVAEIIAAVRARGDAALLEYNEKYEKAKLDALEVSPAEFDAALKAAGYSGAKMTKEAQKLIDDNKPDGKARPQK